MNAVAFEKLESADVKVKYTFVRDLLTAGKENPEELYPYLPEIISMLDSENNIVTWAAIELLGDLIGVDADHKIRALLPRLYMYLDTGKMITANNAVVTLSEIAKTELGFQDEIIEELLKIEGYEYDTDECKNIVYGTIIKGMNTCYPAIREEKTKKKVFEFIRKQEGNTRNATKKKAAAFLKKYSRQEQG